MLLEGIGGTYLASRGLSDDGHWQWRGLTGTVEIFVCEATMMEGEGAIGARRTGSSTTSAKFCSTDVGRLRHRSLSHVYRSLGAPGVFNYDNNIPIERHILGNLYFLTFDERSIDSSICLIV